MDGRAIHGILSEFREEWMDAWMDGRASHGRLSEFREEWMNRI